ncbi:MAG: UDP-3-O-(3-hydroxymyristoyl)glucosamine N-acyltransferase [Alphaproteobacteria bacterium]|nr:UDP-3-O-(3-hydroxymyristoyl)glucosamine N-acyltransferase [Alphaproteobacteria bacterium SS10]
MPDQRFHHRAGPFTLGDLAELTGAELSDSNAASLSVEDVAPLSDAGEGQITFLDNRKYVAAFRATKAAACLVHPDLADQAPDGVVCLVTDKPYRAYGKVAQAFYPEPAIKPGVGAGAFVDPSATVDAGAEIGPNAVIGAGASIGAGTVVGPNAVIGENVEIGERSRIGANASISHAIIGNEVKVYPGVRIGQDGFGFDMSAEGHLRIPQLGRVIVEDDVEIGANATIDRGAGPDTVIGRGVRIDNLVQIGHNAKIGPGVVLVAQCGISGSSEMGPFSVLAAQAGIAGHLKIGAGAQIGAQAGVMRDVEAGEKVIGSPAVPIKQFFRQVSTLKKMAEGRG